MVVHFDLLAVFVPEVLVELAPHRGLRSAGIILHVWLVLVREAALPEARMWHRVLPELPLEIIVAGVIILPLLVAIVKIAHFAFSSRRLLVLLRLENDNLRISWVL